MTSPEPGPTPDATDPTGLRAAAHAADVDYRAAKAEAAARLDTFARCIADAYAAYQARKDGGTDPGFRLIDLSRDSHTIEGSKGWSRMSIEQRFAFGPTSRRKPGRSVDLRARAHAADRSYQEARGRAEELLGVFRSRVADAYAAIKAKRDGGPDPGFTLADVIRDTWTIEGTDGWSANQIERFARGMSGGRLRRSGGRVGQAPTCAS